MSIHRTIEYLRGISDFPLAIVVDLDGQEWTWAEGRSGGIALRGALPGLPKSVVRWAAPRGWRTGMRAAFAAPRRRASRVYARERLLDWAGQPWIPPSDPCQHCAGTGHRLGTSTSMSRPGAIRDGVLVDRNLVGRFLLPFEPGALIVDALKGKTEDAVRIRTPGGDSRAVIARMHGHTEGMLTFEHLDAEQPGSLALDGPAAPGEPRKPPECPETPPGRKWVESPDDPRPERPGARRVARIDLIGSCLKCGNDCAGRFCLTCEVT